MCTRDSVKQVVEEEEEKKRKDKKKKKKRRICRLIVTINKTTFLSSREIKILEIK